MSKDSEELTTFLIRFGAFKYLVIPFDLYNSPAFWQYLINDTLFNFFHYFVQTYLNNIFIYNKKLKKYYSHICQVL